MKERPILFNGDMVRAILDGRKTQTRRVIKGVGPDNWLKGASNHVVHAANKCPYGQPGDRLWVRESFLHLMHGDVTAGDIKYCARIDSRSTDNSKNSGYWWRKRPSIHMPRWASRIILEIVSVRVERLQVISEADAIAEGCYTNDVYSDLAGENDVWHCVRCKGFQVHEQCSMAGCTEVDCNECNTPVKRFKQLWQRINGAESWAANPWVWVVEFKRIKP